MQDDCMQKDYYKKNTENCVLCGCDTDIPITMPVDCRRHYIQGCGQLCELCHVELKQELTLAEKKGMIETH